MKSETDEELRNNKSVKVVPEFIRPHLARPFSFLTSKLPPAVEKSKEQETEHELSLLYEKFKTEGRRPSGGDTHLLTTRIAQKYQDNHIQNGFKTEIWQLSERTLNILRTPGLCPVCDEATVRKSILVFFERIGAKYFPELDPASMFYLGPRSDTEVEQMPVEGPNEYFVITQPELVTRYGYPFHSSVAVPTARSGYPSEPMVENVLGINTTFWGAFAGGDRRLGHDVVFYLPENRFYFFDPVMDQYVPTSEAKLRIGVSLAIQRQAVGLLVDKASVIISKFLTDEVLDQIMDKAKTLLSVERGYFEGPNAKARFTADKHLADEIATTVREFIESQIDEDDTSILTISECLEALNSYHQKQGLSVPRYKEIKVVVQTTMKEVFGKGVRNDIVLPDRKCVAGWKGLKLERPKVGESEIRESGQSVESGLSS